MLILPPYTFLYLLPGKVDYLNGHYRRVITGHLIVTLTYLQRPPK